MRSRFASTVQLSLAAVVASGGLIAGCASAEPYNPSNLAPQDRAEVADLCSNVIGIGSGTEQHYACVEALSASVRGVTRARGLGVSRSECLTRGFAPGSADLARCELDRSRAYEAGPQRVALLSPSAPASPPQRSYWSASNAEVHRREQDACARLGLEPASADFGQCVASLDQSLFAADNPSH